MNPASVECSICLGKYCSIEYHFSSIHYLIIKTYLSETYKPPIRMTDCGHSFCEQCIVPAYPNPGWRCPLCNKTHNHSAANLARNYFAEQLLTAFQAQSTQAPTSAPRRSGGEFGLCNRHQQNITICEF